MSYKKFEIIENGFYSPFFTTETSIFPPKPLSINPFFTPSFEFENDLTFSLLDSVYDSVPNSFFNSVSTDLVRIESTPFGSHLTRLTRRVDSPELTHLKALSDQVASLESKFDRLLHVKARERRLLREFSEVDRKYSWTAEIKGDVEKKYKWTAEIERDDFKEGKRGERKYQWSTEVKGGGKDDGEKRVYTWKATIGGGEEKKKVNKKENEKKEKKSGKGSGGARIVEIDGPFDDHRTVVLRQAFVKRISNDKGKRKELSPLDAAALIQLSFRNYLLRRSQALRALRELAVAKTKLKELRALFHNFSYRSHLSRDAEERQKFSEKIIVLLLTVDAIEGVDLMVRAAKRSMVDELEAMLDVVDPQPGSMRSLSMRRRTFDMPSGTIQKEIAEGVAQVVQMLDEGNETFEACV